MKMKLINSKKILKEGDSSGGYFGFRFERGADEEEFIAPCYEVKIDRLEKKAIMFLIDGEEKYSFSLRSIKLPLEQLSLSQVSEFISLFRLGDIDSIKKTLGVK